MSKDDLKKMLDLPGETGAVSSIPITEGARAGPASEYALDLDRWGKRKGTELAESEGFSELDISSKSIADFYGSAFEMQPRLTEETGPPWKEFLEAAMQTSEYQELHESTKLDAAASEIAAMSFASQYHALCEKESPDDLDTIRAAGKALDGAGKDVEDYRSACEAAGLGQGEGGSHDPKRSMQLYKKIRGDDRLQRIFNRAGRFRRYAQGLQRQKATHGMDDMVGITTGGEPHLLIASELARLGDVDMEMDLYRRLVERQTMIRHHKSTEPTGKGPIIVTVDESGSMQGAKHETAKALALTLAWLAAKQRRWCALVGFSGGIEGTLCLLEPGKWREEELIDWLLHFYGGGTTLDVPIGQMPDIYRQTRAPEGQTDLISITDAIVHCPEDMAKTFRAWKAQAQARYIALVIEERSAGDVGRLADEVYFLPSLEIGAEGVDKVLSI